MSGAALIETQSRDTGKRAGLSGELGTSAIPMHLRIAGNQPGHRSPFTSPFTLTG